MSATLACEHPMRFGETVSAPSGAPAHPPCQPWYSLRPWQAQRQGTASFFAARSPRALPHRRSPLANLELEGPRLTRLLVELPIGLGGGDWHRGCAAPPFLPCWQYAGGPSRYRSRRRYGRPRRRWLPSRFLPQILSHCPCVGDARLPAIRRNGRDRDCTSGKASRLPQQNDGLTPRAAFLAAFERKWMRDRATGLVGIAIGPPEPWSASRPLRLLDHQQHLQGAGIDDGNDVLEGEVAVCTHLRQKVHDAFREARQRHAARDVRALRQRA